MTGVAKGMVKSHWALLFECQGKWTVVHSQPQGSGHLVGSSSAVSPQASVQPTFWNRLSSMQDHVHSVEWPLSPMQNCCCGSCSCLDLLGLQKQHTCACPRFTPSVDVMVWSFVIMTTHEKQDAPARCAHLQRQKRKAAPM